MKTELEFKTEGIVQEMYHAFVMAGGKENADTRNGFVFGMQATLLFFDYLKDDIEDPMVCARAFVKFRKVVREAYDKECAPMKPKPTNNGN